MALSPRHRRLLADLNQMNELPNRARELSFRVEGDPPETYHLMMSLPGLARDGEGRLVVQTVHRCTVYLHADYPRRPPVITWLTPIVHPNILPPEYDMRGKEVPYVLPCTRRTRARRACISRPRRPSDLPGLRWARDAPRPKS